jgi:hypothetical protein
VTSCWGVSVRLASAVSARCVLFWNTVEEWPFLLSLRVSASAWSCVELHSRPPASGAAPPPAPPSCKARSGLKPSREASEHGNEDDHKSS